MKRHFNNPSRLKLGSVLVDAGYNGNSHMKISVAGGHKKTYDFEGYRKMYGELMKKDDMYLGYYLHLVQDVIYRHFPESVKLVVLKYQSPMDWLTLDKQVVKDGNFVFVDCFWCQITPRNVKNSFIMTYFPLISCGLSGQMAPMPENLRKQYTPRQTHAAKGYFAQALSTVVWHAP